MQTRMEGRRTGEQGFMLLGLIVAIFFILLALSVAAPRVARALRRDQEVESEHRAQQYVRAIRLYYMKLGHYPSSIEQLEKTNNIRFLRQKYVDPMTGKADWRLIHQGEAKTTVKGLFGQPLAGLATGNLGSASGSQSAGGVGTAAGNAGFSASSTSSSSFGAASGTGSGTTGTTSSGTGTTSTTGNSSFGSAGNATVDSSSSGSSLGSGVSSQSASSFTGGGPIMGIGSSASGDAILVVNEQTTYPTWEFLYDPRIEALSKGVNLFGGGVASTSAGSLGSASSLSSGFGSNSSATTNGSTTTTGTSTSGTSGSSTPTTTPTSPQ